MCRSSTRSPDCVVYSLLSTPKHNDHSISVRRSSASRSQIFTKSLAQTLGLMIFFMSLSNGLSSLLSRFSSSFSSREPNFHSITCFSHSRVALEDEKGIGEMSARGRRAYSSLKILLRFLLNSSRLSCLHREPERLSKWHIRIL